MFEKKWFCNQIYYSSAVAEPFLLRLGSRVGLPRVTHTVPMSNGKRKGAGSPGGSAKRQAAVESKEAAVVVHGLQALQALSGLPPRCLDGAARLLAAAAPKSHKDWAVTEQAGDALVRPGGSGVLARKRRSPWTSSPASQSLRLSHLSARADVRMAAPTPCHHPLV